METTSMGVDKTAEVSGKSTGFENVKNIIADKLHCMAEGLDKNAAAKDPECGMAKCGKQASEWLDQTADCIREFDCKKTDAKIREYVRQNPQRSLLMAGGAALILGAIFRRR